jgi:predicted DNA-binding protein
LKERDPISFKVEPELSQRLEEAAEKVGIKKSTLMIMALEATLEAIEKNDYRIVVPIEFKVTHVPVPTEEKYPERDPRARPYVMNESPGGKPLPPIEHIDPPEEDPPRPRKKR